ncbi:MAG: hypothetical protein ACKPKO_25650, partial [Candidatus Fonsibacter sp.]
YMLRLQKENQYKITLTIYIYHKMDPINRQFMVMRLAAVKQRRCYIQIFKLIVEHNVPYTVNMNGVFFNMSLARGLGTAD